MTLDNQPKSWRRMARLASLWIQLPEGQDHLLVESLPSAEQDRFDAFLITAQKPAKALKELEKYICDGYDDVAVDYIAKMPKYVLDRLIRYQFKNHQLKDKLLALEINNKRFLTFLCACRKDILAAWVLSYNLQPSVKRRIFKPQKAK